MNLLEWVNYAAFIAGVIGSIAGVIGVCIALKSHRKVEKIKSLDLRIELKRSINEVRSILDDSEKLLPRANKSRLRVLSATGLIRSGQRDKWDADYAGDLNKLKHFAIRFSRAEEQLSLESYDALEQKLDVVDQLKYEVLALKATYKEAILSDDNERERLLSRT
ncbi:hypothetical protein SNR37_001591 [Agarivorans aestuarii]|uniref:DUF2489 domain-containing protein n=1 Tax=Agarivorans aestuarii TaxID=1563703 RepID=A0ABU7GA56_9ALTE|nr:hypothetical protein [Agarivorans aestuarii]MEE1676259.1 hypothetical protein [Agarivorans aestuarii]